MRGSGNPHFSRFPPAYRPSPALNENSNPNPKHPYSKQPWRVPGFSFVCQTFSPRHEPYRCQARRGPPSVQSGLPVQHPTRNSKSIDRHLTAADARLDSISHRHALHPEPCETFQNPKPQPENPRPGNPKPWNPKV